MFILVLKNKTKSYFRWLILLFYLEKKKRLFSRAHYYNKVNEYYKLCTEYLTGNILAKLLIQIYVEQENT